MNNRQLSFSFFFWIYGFTLKLFTLLFLSQLKNVSAFLLIKLIISWKSCDYQLLLTYKTWWLTILLLASIEYCWLINYDFDDQHVMSWDIIWLYVRNLKAIRCPVLSDCPSKSSGQSPLSQLANFAHCQCFSDNPEHYVS